MDKVFKISGVVSYMKEHECDCEFCEHRGDVEDSEVIEAAVYANTLVDARAKIISEYMLDETHSFDWSRATVEEIDVPKGKVFFIAGRILTGDGYTSDGSIALPSDSVCGTFSKMIGNDKDGVAIAAVVEGAPPIDESPLREADRVSDGRYLKFSDGDGFEALVGRQYAAMVQRIGAGLHKTAKTPDKLLAIVKDGQHVGALMPVHRTR